MARKTVRVFILRGLSGSGKSALAKDIVEGDVITVCSADDYPGLYDSDGNIRFSKRDHAHDWCYARFCEALQRGESWVVVDNTNTTLMEMAPYRMEARRNHVPVEFIHVTSDATDKELAENNRHNVPEHSIAAQRARWEKLPPFWEKEYQHEGYKPIRPIIEPYDDCKEYATRL